MFREVLLIGGENVKTQVQMLYDGVSTLLCFLLWERQDAVSTKTFRAYEILLGSKNGPEFLLPQGSFLPIVTRSGLVFVVSSCQLSFIGRFSS